MIELLIELDRAKKAESCKYHLVLDETGINSQECGFFRYGEWFYDDRIKLMYLLVDMKSGEVVSSGFKHAIARYLRAHRVQLEQVLDVELLKLTTLTYYNEIRREAERRSDSKK